MIRKRAIAGVALTIGLFAAMPSDAAAFQIVFDPAQGSDSTENTGASALFNFSFAQNGNDVDAALQITNTTASTDGETVATLVGFAINFGVNFDYDPLTSPFTKVITDSNFAPYGTFEICVRSEGSGNCVGGDPTQGLVATPGSNVTNVLFTFPDQIAINLENSLRTSIEAAARFQQVGSNLQGSDKVLGIVVAGTVPSDMKIPEPATLALIGAGLVAGGLAGRRRRAG